MPLLVENPHVLGLAANIIAGWSIPEHAPEAVVEFTQNVPKIPVLDGPGPSWDGGERRVDDEDGVGRPGLQSRRPSALGPAPRCMRLPAQRLAAVGFPNHPIE